MKYRKRPVEIEAFRLGYGQMPAWFMRAVDDEKVRLWPNGSEYVEIDTLEGADDVPRCPYSTALPSEPTKRFCSLMEFGVLWCDGLDKPDCIMLDDQ